MNIWEILVNAGSSDTVEVELPSDVVADVHTFVKEFLTLSVPACLADGSYTPSFPVAITSETTGKVSTAMPSFLCLVLAQLFLERLCFSEGRGGLRPPPHTIAVGTAIATCLTTSSKGKVVSFSTKGKTYRSMPVMFPSFDACVAAAGASLSLISARTLTKYKYGGDAADYTTTTARKTKTDHIVRADATAADASMRKAKSAGRHMLEDPVRAFVTTKQCWKRGAGSKYPYTLPGGHDAVAAHKKRLPELISSISDSLQRVVAGVADQPVARVVTVRMMVDAMVGWGWAAPAALAAMASGAAVALATVGIDAPGGVQSAECRRKAVRKLVEVQGLIADGDGIMAATGGRGVERVVIVSIVQFSPVYSGTGEPLAVKHEDPPIGTDTVVLIAAGAAGAGAGTDASSHHLLMTANDVALFLDQYVGSASVGVAIDNSAVWIRFLLARLAVQACTALVVAGHGASGMSVDAFLAPALDQEIRQFVHEFPRMARVVEFTARGAGARPSVKDSDDFNAATSGVAIEWLTAKLQVFRIERAGLVAQSDASIRDFEVALNRQAETVNDHTIAVHVVNGFMSAGASVKTNGNGSSASGVDCRSAATTLKILAPMIVTLACAVDERGGQPMLVSFLCFGIRLANAVRLEYAQRGTAWTQGFQLVVFNGKNPGHANPVAYCMLRNCKYDAERFALAYNAYLNTAIEAGDFDAPGDPAIEVGADRSTWPDSRFLDAKDIESGERCDPGFIVIDSLATSNM